MLTQQGVKEAIRENSFVPIHFKIYEKDAQLPSQNGLSSHKTFKRKDCNECSGSLEGSLKNREGCAYALVAEVGVEPTPQAL